MITVDRLQSYIRRIVEQDRQVIAMPPFTIFLHPDDNRTFFNYAIPDAPVGGESSTHSTSPSTASGGISKQPGSGQSLGTSLAALRAVFVERRRRPRFEFIAEFAPDLAPALRAHGFAEESRLQLMVCTPATYRAAPDVAGLTVAVQDTDTPVDEIRTGLDTNTRGFDPRAAPVTEAEANSFRSGLVTSRAFLARLDGQPAGAGMFTPPLDGLTELVGIATLEQFRRRGVATVLTARAVQTAFEQGVETAFLSAADERAGRVYERVGFRPFATMLAYIAEN